MLKTKLVASKLVTSNNQLSSSTKFIGGLKEKLCICLFILNSSVSCGSVFDCLIDVLVFFFYLKVTIRYSFKYSESFSCYDIFNDFFCSVKSFLFCFLGSEHCLSRLVYYLLFVHFLESILHCHQKLFFLMSFILKKSQYYCII